MKRKVLLFLISIAASFSLLAACSDNSDGSNAVASDDSVISVPPNTSELKGEFFDFKVSSCEEVLAKRKYDDEGDEYIDFYVNEDGSAFVNAKFAIACDGLVSLIYETKNDTLFVTQNYTRLIKRFDPVTGDSVVTGSMSGMSHCSCIGNFELTIPSEFVGTKYVDFGREYYSIIYKKNK